MTPRDFPTSVQSARCRLCGAHVLLDTWRAESGVVLAADRGVVQPRDAAKAHLTGRTVLAFHFGYPSGSQLTVVGSHVLRDELATPSRALLLEHRCPTGEDT